jgi:ComF family protein
MRALAQPLAELLFTYIKEKLIKADILVPVPLHKDKLKERGYNQAELLAVELGKLTGWPVEKESLVRLKDAVPQAKTASASERHRNVEGAFICRNSRLQDRAVLLIDDVCTTGATINACGAALKRLPVSSVWALTIAREL